MTTEQENLTQKKTGSSVLSPEGIFILGIAGILDLLGYVSVVLYLLLGVGVLLGRIVSVVGFIIIGGWQFTRSGTLPSMSKEKKDGAVKGAATKLAKKFFKKHWKKLALELTPIAGDLMPSFFLIVLEEFKD